MSCGESSIRQGRIGRRLLLASLVLFAWVTTACSGFTPRPGPGNDPPGRYLMLTTPIVAVGDTQEHESTGYPLRDNDSAVDAYVEVAQRPPEQPLFGRRILEWALKSHPTEPFLHLGDVMDLSCRSEGERMAKVFRNAGRPGAILPGNHDGLMFGIYNYRILDAVLDADAVRWNLACRRGASAEDGRFKTAREAMSKRDFINLYLSEQARFRAELPGFEAPPQRGARRLSWRNPRDDVFVSGIEANLLDGYQYADSFVSHRLKLPRAPGADRDVVVIGLDTNQAGLVASTWDTLMGRSPGSMGHVNLDQIRAVTRWINEASRNGDIVVFAGHHDWLSLGLPTRVLLRNLMSTLNHPLVYLSAHTHRGFWAEHRSLDRRPLLELNVSSLSDWPIAYRRLSFGYDEAANRLMVRGELMPNANRPVRSDADLSRAWESETCAAAGVDMRVVQRHEVDLVARQRAGRGTILQWLVSALAPVCESCERPLYDHAQAYQDVMLETILQLDNDLARDAHRLSELTLPDWCAGQDFAACARTLMSQSPTDDRSNIDLFRRKAVLVDLLSRHLDDLNGPRAAAYMTCRAVQAAKLDFDATDDSANSDRGEAKRRAEQFFRVEATVGME